jgi:hypothetical protein
MALMPCLVHIGFECYASKDGSVNESTPNSIPIVLLHGVIRVVLLPLAAQCHALRQFSSAALSMRDRKRSPRPITR